jgi:hypothetical protein
LPIAVRVYPDLQPTQPDRRVPQIDGMLVFDCETRIDKTQALSPAIASWSLGAASKKGSSTPTI